MKNGAATPAPEPKPVATKGGKVGYGYKVTNPEAVHKVKGRLYELEYYDPDEPARLTDGKVERELGDAIEAYQLTLDNPYKNKPELWPDGVVDVGGYTWNHLFPPEATSEEPSTPEQPTSDPTRTVYSLFMHLQPLTPQAARAAGIDWVERAKVSTGSDPVNEPEEAPGEDRFDREEADSHLIKADVYLGSTNTADIEWVERRLITLGFLTARAEATGVSDGDLDAAIKAFQAEYPWPDKSNYWDGFVQKGGKTDKYLRKTAFELAALKETSHGSAKDPIDPAFTAALAKLDRFGIAEVVSGLNVRVSGGKPLWKSGRTSSFNVLGGPEIRPEIHWEVFSEALQFPSWDVIDDKDDDLHADLPTTILEKIDVWPDKILSPLEILAFYQGDAARDLRRTACRFRSEWGLDMDRTISRLEQLQFSTLGVREALEPYQWWDRVGDALPKGLTHVWHYNPIEFFRVYQEILNGMKAPDPLDPPEPQDPDTHGDLTVHVRAANGMPPKNSVTVVLSYELTSYAGEKTDATGTAKFRGLPLATYDVPVMEADEVSQSAEVLAYTTNEVSLETPLEGKPVKRGELTVWVRKATGGAAVSAQVSISGANLDRTFGVLEVGKQSKVIFQDLQGGEYRVNVVYPAKPAHPNEHVEVEETVIFDGTKEKARVTLPRGWSDVRVLHDDGGVVVTGNVLDEHGKVVQPIATDGSGQAVFRVRLGKYKIELGGHKKGVDVRLPATEVKV